MAQPWPLRNLALVFVQVNDMLIAKSDQKVRGCGGNFGGKTQEVRLQMDFLGRDGCRVIILFQRGKQ